MIQFVRRRLKTLFVFGTLAGLLYARDVCFGGHNPPPDTGSDAAGGGG